MDRITEALLKEFCSQYGLGDLPEDKQFEHLGAYLIVSRFQSETFDIGELVVGDTNDTGFDSLAIIVNGALVTDPESVNELADRNKYIDASFIFVQSERTPSFSSSKIGQIAFGVEDFFKDSHTLPRNDRVDDAAATMAQIYARSNLFRTNPSCRVFYVTTGKWIGDQQLEARRKAGSDA